MIGVTAGTRPQARQRPKGPDVNVRRWPSRSDVPARQSREFLGLEGSCLSAASALPLGERMRRGRRMAALMPAAILRPRRLLALVVLLIRTRREHVFVSGTPRGQAIRTYLNSRSLWLFPQNRFCRGVLLLPAHHADYVRGRHRQALRTNVRKAAAAGIRCETLVDSARALRDASEILSRRRTPLTDQEARILTEIWPTVFARSEVTVLIARDACERPLAITAAVVDEVVCLIRIAVASNHEARWLLHDHLVRYLIGRGVRYLVVEGGGPFGSVGFAYNVRHYQRLLGYELRHVIPTSSANCRPRVASDSVP
jgi:hypothetical protein